eukprot:2654643-Pleurochrysis_carterae.AAC.1
MPLWAIQVAPHTSLQRNTATNFEVAAMAGGAGVIGRSWSINPKIKWESTENARSSCVASERFAEMVTRAAHAVVAAGCVWLKF